MREQKGLNVEGIAYGRAPREGWHAWLKYRCVIKS